MALPSEVLHATGRKIVADKQLIDDELNFLGIEIDVPTPPSLELQIARRFCVDLGVQIVLLGPKRVGGVLVLEILHQPGAIELAPAEVAGERRQPAAAQAGRRYIALGSCHGRRPSMKAATLR